MAIEINNPKDVINPPKIRITGRRVSVAGSKINTELFRKYATYTLPDKLKKTGGSTWTNRNHSPMTFSGDVLLEIVPHDALIHHPHDYSLEEILRRNNINKDRDRKRGIICIGKDREGAKGRGTTRGVFGKNTNTYYSVNGKKPTRSQAHLYTGPVILCSNQTGSGKTTIRVKTYWKGGILGVSEITSEIYIIPSMTTRTAQKTGKYSQISEMRHT